MKSIISESVFFGFYYILCSCTEKEKQRKKSSASHFVFPFKQQKLKFITELDLLHTEVQNYG